MKAEKKYHTREIPATHSASLNIATKQFADNRPSNAIQILQKQIMQRWLGRENGLYLPQKRIQSIMQRYVTPPPPKGIETIYPKTTLDFSDALKTYQYNPESEEYNILKQLVESDVCHSFEEIPGLIEKAMLHRQASRLASRQGQGPLKTDGVKHEDGLLTIEQNEILEKHIGHLLLVDTRVLQAAEKICTIISSYSTVKDIEIQKRADRHKDTWAGAAGYHAYGTSKDAVEKSKLGVNEYVYAATQHLEITMKEALGEVGYKEWRVQYPESNVLHQRLEGITFDCTNDKVSPKQWHKSMKSRVCKAYNILYNKNFFDERIMKHLQWMYDNNDEGYSELLMNLRFSVSTDLVGDALPPLACTSKLGSGVRQGNAGAQYNVVINNPYIEKAKKMKKPLLSGPSGTAFRFVRGWAHIMALQKITTPSIVDALLVSMANLLPPNAHHSYHEIMDGVVGIGGLQYTDPRGYGDIATMRPDIFKAALSLCV